MPPPMPPRPLEGSKLESLGTGSAHGSIPFGTRFWFADGRPVYMVAFHGAFETGTRRPCIIDGRPV